MRFPQVGGLSSLIPSWASGRSRHIFGYADSSDPSLCTLAQHVKRLVFTNRLHGLAIEKSLLSLGYWRVEWSGSSSVVDRRDKAAAPSNSLDLLLPWTQWIPESIDHQN